MAIQENATDKTEDVKAKNGNGFAAAPIADVVVLRAALASHPTIRGAYGVTDSTDGQMLAQQTALARFTRELLGLAHDTEARSALLRRAFSHLLRGLETKRVALFKNVHDDAIGPSFELVSDAVTDERLLLMQPPMRLVYTRIPHALCGHEHIVALSSGEAQRLPAAMIYQNSPRIQGVRTKSGSQPLLAAPLHSNGKWWGVLACHDHGHARLWGTTQGSLLRDAADVLSQVIGNWQTEDALRAEEKAAAAAQERRRLARDLHDSVVQTLHSQSLLAGSWAREYGQTNHEATADRMEQLAVNARQAMAEMRVLLHQTRHPGIDDGGLVAAIERRLNAVERRAGISADLRMHGSVEKIPPYVIEHIYFAIREALNNALRHARAGHVEVIIVVQEDGTSVTVRDDGAGFDVAAPSSGMGLQNMRERASIIGARFDLTSAPGQGTIVSLVLPADQRSVEG